MRLVKGVDMETANILKKDKYNLILRNKKGFDEDLMRNDIFIKPSKVMEAYIETVNYAIKKGEERFDKFLSSLGVYGLDEVSNKDTIFKIETDFRYGYLIGEYKPFLEKFIWEDIKTKEGLKEALEKYINYTVMSVNFNTLKNDVPSTVEDLKEIFFQKGWLKNTDSIKNSKTLNQKDLNTLMLLYLNDRGKESRWNAPDRFNKIANQTFDNGLFYTLSFLFLFLKNMDIFDYYTTYIGKSSLNMSKVIPFIKSMDEGTFDILWSNFSDELMRLLEELFKEIDEEHYSNHIEYGVKDALLDKNTLKEDILIWLKAKKVSL
jgi:hypothetical protein